MKRYIGQGLGRSLVQELVSMSWGVFTDMEDLKTPYYWGFYGSSIM